MPQRSKALLTSVFCTSTITPDEASTRDNSSTASMASKNLAPPAAVLLGDLDAHQPELEKIVDEVFIKNTLLVHFFDQRTNLLVGKLADVVAEENFVIRERGQRGGCMRLAGPRAWEIPSWVSSTDFYGSTRQRL